MELQEHSLGEARKRMEQGISGIYSDDILLHTIRQYIKEIK